MLKADKPERRAGKPPRSARLSAKHAFLKRIKSPTKGEKRSKEKKENTDVGKDSGNSEHSRDAKTAQP